MPFSVAVQRSRSSNRLANPFLRSLGVTLATTDSMVSVSDEIRLASTNPQGLLWMSLAPQACQVVPISANGSQDRGTEMAEAGADLISCQLFQLVECVGIAQGGDGGASVELQISLSAESLAGARLTVHFQDIISTLNRFWADRGCLLLQPYDTEKGAGTMSPHTVLRAIGPEPGPWPTRSPAAVQPMVVTAITPTVPSTISSTRC